MSSFFGKSDKEKEDDKKADEAKKKVDDEQPDQNPDNKPKDDKEDDHAQNVCQMKRGDYMIHIYVERAKNLLVDAEDKIDPIVQINCLGERKFTKAQEDIGNTDIAIWDEHLFFEPKNKEVEDLEKAKVAIKLMDKGFFKDALIGYYEFDLTYLYQQKDHATLHKWIIMSNPESETFGEITGQLKLSITITGEGDEQIQIVDDPNPEKEDIIQPPQVKPKFYQLHFKFFQAQKVVALDTKLVGKNSSDVYIRLDYKTTKLKSKILKIEDQGSGNFNQEFLVPAQLPLIGGRVVFKIFDHNTALADELIGSIHMELKKILPDANGKKGGLEGVWDWKQIYGSPLDVSGKMTDKMNLNPEIASFWKGRILMRTTCEETEKPLLKVKPIADDEVDLAQQYCVNRKFAAKIYVNQLICIPKEGEKYRVSVRITDKEWISKDPIGHKSKYNRFNEIITGKEEEPFESPYLSLKDMGTLMIYVWQKMKIGKDKRVCFWKGDIMQFTDPNPKQKWINLEPDLAIGEVKEHYNAGIVGVKISLHDITADGPIDWKDHPVWAKRPKKYPDIFNVRVFCWQARDLPAADESGKSDPFLAISDTDKIVKTKVVYDSVNPIFFEGIEITYEANEKEELPPMIVDCFDEDETLTGTSQDYLARATIDLQDDQNVGENNDIKRPVWYPMYYKSGGVKSGEVLLSFAVNGDDFQYKIPKQIVGDEMVKQVQMNEFQISLNILGLRGLQSPGMLPVKKAFLVFNLKSMVPPQLGNSLENIKTEPKMAGSDPTLNTLIQFNAPLPVDTLFCPRLAVTAHDSIAMGVNQPIIGNFVIPVGELMLALIKEREEETAEIDKVVKILTKYLAGDAIQASLRTKMKGKIEEQVHQQQQDLEEVRVKQAMKDDLASKLIQTRNPEDSNSINESGKNFDTTPLLTGDHTEETRQSVRVAEAERAAVDGSATRIDAERIEEVKTLVKPEDEPIKAVKISASEQLRSQSRANSGPKKDNHFDPKAKKGLLIAQAMQQGKNRRATEDIRSKAEQKNKNAWNVVMPQYEEDPLLNVWREKEAPDSNLFIGLGYDKDKDSKQKHYRKFYPEELEKVKDVLPNESPFNSYQIKRGQTRGAKVSFWKRITNDYTTDASGQVNTEKFVGKFKAVIEVEARDARKKYMQVKDELIDKMTTKLQELAKNRGIQDFDLDLKLLETSEGRTQLRKSLIPLEVNHLGIVKKLANIQSDEILKNLLLRNTKCIVRAYVIEGFDLASRDIGGYSDPYLIVKLGKKEHNERKNYQVNELNPIICKKFDFEATFPGAPLLEIQCMDHDFLFGDDLIGNTYVDLEDRYFLPEWRGLKQKPVEFRELKHPSSAAPQGSLKMWVEINETNVPPEQMAKVWNIEPKPPQEFQMRVCVFDTKDIKMCDEEGTSDVYIRSFFNSKEALETDTHYRCQTGKASFNYRLNFKVKYPSKNWTFTVQAYDRDFFKSNDIIGAAQIELKKPFDDAELTQRPLRIDKKYYTKYMRPLQQPETPALEFEEDGESFWMPMKQIEIDKKKGTKKTVDNGHVRVRIDITTMEFADKNKVGSARDDPNTEPYLPPPVGRIHFTLNPFEMYKQLIGPAMRRKIAIWCCIFIGSCLCVLILYYLVPIVVGGLITNWISSW